MGYNTNFELTLDSRLEEYKTYLALECESYLKDLYEYTGIFYGNGWKWYNHEEDIRKVSLRFPDVLFTLHGVGEEYPDIWIKYFKNGKMQRRDAIITFEPFDPTEFE